MNPRACEDALAMSLGKVLDEAAFIFGEPTEEAPPFEGDVLETSLDFYGDAEGQMMLRTSVETARSLAEALLGVGPGEASPEDAAAALQELLNIAAGVFMEEYYGVSSLVHLRPPTAAVCADMQVAASNHNVSLLTDEAARLDFGVRL